MHVAGSRSPRRDRRRGKSGEGAGGRGEILFFFPLAPGRRHPSRRRVRKRSKYRRVNKIRSDASSRARLCLNIKSRRINNRARVVPRARLTSDKYRMGYLERPRVTCAARFVNPRLGEHSDVLRRDFGFIGPPLVIDPVPAVRSAFAFSIPRSLHVENVYTLVIRISSRNIARRRG